jgi:hypothetical protein
MTGLDSPLDGLDEMGDQVVPTLEQDVDLRPGLPGADPGADQSR